MGAGNAQVVSKHKTVYTKRELRQALSSLALYMLPAPQTRAPNIGSTRLALTSRGPAATAHGITSNVVAPRRADQAYLGFSGMSMLLPYLTMATIVTTNITARPMARCLWVKYSFGGAM